MTLDLPETDSLILFFGCTFCNQAPHKIHGAEIIAATYRSLPVSEDKILDKLFKIDTLPTLPTFAIEANRMVSNWEEVGSRDLSDIIEKDQAMASEVLRIANSAFLGRKEKISDIAEAITCMGITLLRDAVISIPIINLFSDFKLLKGFDIKQFWIHSLSVAITGRHLAEKTKSAPPDICFISGLLHDIGKIALCAYFTDLFEKVWNVHKAEDLTFYEAEKKEIHTDHSKLGGALAKIWKLPPAIVESIEGHHDLQGCDGGCTSLKIVHLSNVVVNRFEVEPERGIERFTIHPSVEKELAFYLENAAEWRPHVEGEIQKAREFFLDDLR